MKSHNHHHFDEKVCSSESKKTPVYATPGGTGRPSAADVQLHGTSGTSHLPASTSRTHSRLPDLGDRLLRTVESDRWSVDSPKESGYYSEESSVGHSGELGSNSMHQRLHNIIRPAGDVELWLIRGEYEMELSLSAESSGNLNGALSHVNKAVDCYHQAVSAADASSDGHVRLRMKYNTAVLRSRQLHKRVTEQSVTSSENVVSRRGQSDDSRRLHGTTDSQTLGAKLYHRTATHAKESSHHATVPFDYQHLYSKPAANQNKAKISSACAGNVSRISDAATPFSNRIEMTAYNHSVAKNGARITAGGAVISAGGLPREEAPKHLLARESRDPVEIYATLPRKSRQQHRPQFADVPQQTFHPGISHTAGVSGSVYDQAHTEMSRRSRRQDKTSLPPYDSLSRLKISWC